MPPRVSVFLFCKDRAQSIRRSVDSVLAQTYRDFEYVIQDGASTDGTLELLRAYDDPRIDLRSEADAGPEEAFWKTLRRCRGEYVCACLSDEELLPRAIEEAVAALDANAGAVAFTRDALLTDLEGRSLSGTNIVRGRRFDLIDYMANRFAPHFAAAMFRRRALDEVGLHTRAWHQECGEFELWCRLALLGPIDYRQGIAAKYALHDRQLSRDRVNAFRIARARLDVIDSLARDTTLFDGCPDVLKACRTATAVSFAHYLSSLGAHAEAIDLYTAVGDQSGRLPTPRPDGTPPEDYVRVARWQRLIGRETLAMQVLDLATRFTAVGPRMLLDIAKSYAELGGTNRALAMYDAAIRRAPHCHEAHWERGLLLEQRGRIDDALDAWRRSGILQSPRRHSLYLVASLKSPRSTNHSLWAAHQQWASLHAPPPRSRDGHRFPSWQSGDRIAVGYACSFWDSDTITYQLLPVLRRHDRRQFRIIAYAHTPPGRSVQDAVDEVRIVGGFSNAEYVARVREDGVHILVELNGHSPGHWFAAMAARGAPVQVSYLNYTSTSGIEEVDYVLGDAIAIPPGSDAYFTEDVYRLPGCFFCFTYDDAPLPPVADPPSLRSGYVTFGCFGSGGKINPTVQDLWAALLRRVPDSRLFIRNNELTARDNREALTRAFGDRGIARGRLLILPGTKRPGVLESYAEVDISLDTFPYCGGNTIAESLWQGVPVVTLKGDRFSSAYGASLLTASGMPELVAGSPEEYVETAAALAADANRLAFYRANLRSMVKTFGFSDADRFTATLEGAYLDMLSRRREPRPHRSVETQLS